MKKSILPRTIGVDFDSTICYHEYPYLGEVIPGAIETMKKLLDAGHTLILITQREPHLMDEASELIRNHGVEIKYVNCNPEFENGSRKIYANLYIDDHGLGIPLINDPQIHRKPFVDWIKVEKILEEKGYL